MFCVFTWIQDLSNHLLCQILEFWHETKWHMPRRVCNPLSLSSLQNHALLPPSVSKLQFFQVLYWVNQCFVNGTEVKVKLQNTILIMKDYSTVFTWDMTNSGKTTCLGIVANIMNLSLVSGNFILYRLSIWLWRPEKKIEREVFINFPCFLYSTWSYSNSLPWRMIHLPLSLQLFKFMLISSSSKCLPMTENRKYNIFLCKTVYDKN